MVYGSMYDRYTSREVNADFMDILTHAVYTKHHCHSETFFSIYVLVNKKPNTPNTCVGCVWVGVER